MVSRIKKDQLKGEEKEVTLKKPSAVQKRKKNDDAQEASHEMNEEVNSPKKSAGVVEKGKKKTLVKETENEAADGDKKKVIKKKEKMTDANRVDTTPSPTSPKKKQKKNASSKISEKTETVSDSQEAKSDKEKKQVKKNGSEKSEEKSSSPVDKMDKNKNAIWIGNLPYSVTHALLKSFFVKCGQITRIKLPTSKKNKTHNRGFAYVNFGNESAVQKALALSETELEGRKVLIKDAQIFERQQKFGPNNNVFVGNLPFDLAEGKLYRVFGTYGQIERLFVARFDDTERCKGYAYLRFSDIASATKAIQRGRLQFPTKGDSRRVCKLEYADPTIFESAVVTAAMEKRKEKLASMKEMRESKRKTGKKESSNSKRAKTEEESADD